MPGKPGDESLAILLKKKRANFGKFTLEEPLDPQPQWEPRNEPNGGILRPDPVLNSID